MVNILLKFLIVLLGGCIVYFIYTMICIIHVEFAFKNQMTILDAIYEYKIDCLDKHIHIDVDFSDMEDDNVTYARLWDWGYKHILPPEKFELVKPYIKKK